MSGEGSAADDGPRAGSRDGDSARDSLLAIRSVSLPFLLMEVVLMEVVLVMR